VNTPAKAEFSFENGSEQFTSTDVMHNISLQLLLEVICYIILLLYEKDNSIQLLYKSIMLHQFITLIKNNSLLKK